MWIHLLRPIYANVPFYYRLGRTFLSFISLWDFKHVNSPIKINHLSFAGGWRRVRFRMGKPFETNVVEKYWNMTNILNHLGFASSSLFLRCVAKDDGKRELFDENFSHRFLSRRRSGIRKIFPKRSPASHFAANRYAREQHILINRFSLPVSFSLASQSLIVQSTAHEKPIEEKAAQKERKWKTIFYWILFPCSASFNSLRVDAISFLFDEKTFPWG